MANSDSDKGENCPVIKLKRSLTSMLDQMKMTDEEISYRIQNFDKVDVIKECLKFLKCTKCGLNFQRVINKGAAVGIHPLLGVLMCKSCCDYYGDGNFSLDSDGEDKYCRWCGEGGTIFVCTKCICGFCDKCIQKHFGTDGLKKVKNDDDWVCYFCNPKPLWHLRSICSLAEQASKSKKEHVKRKRESKSTSLKTEKQKKEENKGSLDEEDLSDSHGSKVSDAQNKKTKRKVHRKSKAATTCTSSSSEDEKENQFSKVRSRPRTRNSRQMDSPEESTGSESKKPKKKQKVTCFSNEDLSQEKMQDNAKSSFEVKKSQVVEKLKGIWKLTELIMEVGMNFSKGRSEKLLRPDHIKTFEDLQTEYRKLKSFMAVLSRTLSTACNSAENLKKDLTSDNVVDERNIYQIEEIKLKSLGKKLQEESDIDIILDDPRESEGEEQKQEPEQEQVNSLEASSGSEVKGNKGSKRNKKSAEQGDYEKSKTIKASMKETTKSDQSSDGENLLKSFISESNGIDGKKKNSEKAKRNEVSRNEICRPLLKVKSFARMTSENVLSTREVVNGTSEKVSETKTDNKSDNVSESASKESKKTNKVDAYDVDTEASSDDEESKSKDGDKEKDQDQGRDLDNDKDKTDEIKKKRRKRSKETTTTESSESNFSDEIEENDKRRVNHVKKKLRHSFKKFRRRREKFLRANTSKGKIVEEKKESDKKETENSKESKTSRNLESSDSEIDKVMLQNRSRRGRKKILDSSDEEKGEKESLDEDEKNSEENSSEEVKKKDSHKDDSDCSVETAPKHSSGETSVDEPNKTKKSKWRKIKKKEKEEDKEDKENDDSDDDHADHDDDDKGDKTDKKKKGRKNIKQILKKDSLHVETKEALKNEQERKKRLEERQKLFESIFPKDEDDKEETPRQVILDFDPETKEPLVTIHKKLVKKLKPHQIKGVKFMWDNCFESVKRLDEDSGTGCILAHCMGLGKTLQVITLVHTLMTHDLGVNTVLIVSPLSTVPNWVNEFEMWLTNIHTEPITVYEMCKYKKSEERISHLEDWHQNGGVLVLSYDLFRNLTKGVKVKRKKNQKVFETTLLDPGPDLVICDEGHLLKNEDTALSKCMNKIKTSRRIVLTGTPLQNNLMEYHCMVQFVKPNILGTKREFTNRFVSPIINGQFEDSTELDVKIMKRRAHVLHSMLSSCVQRYDYSVLTPFLPAKHEYVLSISLTKTQSEVYRYFINNLAAKTTGSSKAATLFNDYHNLQRVWTHPRTMLMHSKKESQKILEDDSDGSLKDFVVDTDGTSISSSSSRESEEAPPTVKKTLRSNANNPEVSEVQEEEKNQNKHWWDDFYKETDYEDIHASNKLVLLLSLLKHCGEVKDKVLVFSQSLYSLDLIEYFLNKIDESDGNEKENELLGGYKDSWVLGTDYFRLDGTTNTDTRSMWCKHFNKESNQRARLFLISTRAGGLGINLFAANRVVIFDASWNPSHDVQSIFRVYRFGQKKTCYIYRFLAEATMEEKIYERQVTKLSLAHRVVDEHQIERHYSMMNLQELYKFDPTPPEKRKVPKLPKDTIFADLLATYKDIIVGFHEHDSLLENREEEELSEEERKAAWQEYEEEKIQKAANINPVTFQNQIQANFLAHAQSIIQTGIPRKGMVGTACETLQNFINPMFQTSIPLHILQKGISLGIAPFYNENCESYFNRVKNRESWMSMGQGPRET